jgi:hypothetical protein
MSELKGTATIPIARQADWVKITSKAVWIGSKGPYAVSEIDLQNNQVTRVELPGDPCAGLARMTVVDTSRTRILCQRKGEGGDAVGVGHGSIWLTNLNRGTQPKPLCIGLPVENSHY